MTSPAALGGERKQRFCPVRGKCAVPRRNQGDLDVHRSRSRQHDLAVLAAGIRAVVASVKSAPESAKRLFRGLLGQRRDHNYSEDGLAAKRQLVQGYLAAGSPREVWDLGGNIGAFSRAAREVAPSVVCFDFDPAAVELNYRQVRERSETELLPLQLDLMSPSPATGWANDERLSLEARGPADAVLALALVHHLAIANNVPFPRIAELFARLGRTLVVESVPKSDSQRLLYLMRWRDA